MIDAVFSERSEMETITPFVARGVARARRVDWRSAVRSRIAARIRRTSLMIAGVALAIFASDASNGGVLTEREFAKVDGIKPLFLNLMGDLVETSKRSDLSDGDADCIKSAIRELVQISDELSSFEYLITIEKEMTDFGENNPMRGIVKFAVEKSNTILAGERKRLTQLSDRCTRFPLSAGKTQQAIQVIDTTAGILTSIHGRL
jgi:hypothetical protein